MTIKIITLYDRNEDFIELQYRSIQKFVKSEVEYIVFNNSADNDRRNRIDEICSRLGIKTFPLYNTYGNPEPSQVVAASLNSIWNNYLKSMRGMIFYIDSDMFFVSEINIEKEMHDKDVVYIPNYRGSNFEVEYIWTGIWGLNLDTIQKDLDFSIGVILGQRTDVGGASHHFLKNRDYRKAYLRFCGIYDGEARNSDTSLNGCEVMKYANGVLINHQPGIERLFPHETPIQNYSEKYLNDYQKHQFLAARFDFPHPYNFDLIRLEDKEDFFVFHYKSANWEPLYGDSRNQYSLLKKAALKRMLDEICL